MELIDKSEQETIVKELVFDNTEIREEFGFGIIKWNKLYNKAIYTVDTVGKHEITVKLADWFGNISTATTIVYIDNKEPDISVNLSSEYDGFNWRKDDVDVIVNVKDMHSGIKEITVKEDEGKSLPEAIFIKTN